MFRSISILFILIIMNATLFAQYNNTTGIDTLNSTLHLSPEINTQSTEYPIVSGTLVGGIGGILGTLGGGLVGAGICRIGNIDTDYGFALIPFAYLGFIMGSSSGVYMVAYNNDLDPSWWLTNVAGLLGTAVGIGITRIEPEEGNLWWSVLILPIVFEVIYVSSYAPETKSNSTSVNPYEKKPLNNTAFYNIYNNSKVIDFNFLTIHF